MNLQIKFKTQRPFFGRADDPVREKDSKDVAARLMNLPVIDRTPSAWRDQKPGMSSARIMMEVRRRLWIEVCSPNTGFYQTEKLTERIRQLNKRIAKRLKKNE